MGFAAHVVIEIVQMFNGWSCTAFSCCGDRTACRTRCNPSGETGNGERVFDVMAYVRHKIVFHCFNTAQFGHHRVEVSEHLVGRIPFVASFNVPRRNITEKSP
ncbi:hypothetical protein [Bifidobacterium goeldii]|uniref:hypothetical protein n=1 Tax=Bifidobacterium goeldii TaxID=2306975 RepID=UPI0013DE7188|nr:hypothetical protein [Bifidobacterium goeldii]